MKITALVENTTTENITTEHGLSLYIETNGLKLLFDMGQTELFYKNAEILSVDLSEIDIAILSHGHYDHGGGLKKFLEINKTAPIYLSRYAFEPHYNGTEKYIGLDISLRSHDRLIFTDDEMKINSDMTLYSCNDAPRKYELLNSGLNMIQNGKALPDDFRHEQYLLVTEGSKKILISGCSHKGIRDITNWFKPDVLVGGFHYSKLPLDEKLASYAQELSDYNTDFYTCHCTGPEQYINMKQYMPRMKSLSCGQTITI